MEYPVLPDKVLLQLMRDDDHAAFRALYDRYWQPLYHKAVAKLASPDAAKEVLQQLFISLWQRRTTLAILDVPAYLYTALRYQVLRRIKESLARDHQPLPGEQPAVTTADAAAASLLQHELSAAIRQAIAALPEKTQTVFRLSRLEHRPVREIAGTMHLSEKAVEYHITRSLRLLRLSLKKFLVFSFLLVFFR